MPDTQELLRTVNRVAATLRALARDEDRPEPMTVSYTRWLALRLYTLADELDGLVQASLPQDDGPLPVR